MSAWTFEQTRDFLARVGRQAPPIDIDFAAVADELRRCETRLVEVDSSVGRHWRQNLLYRSEWWTVGQTSLLDDVATGLCAKSAQEAQTLEKFLAASQFGVRFHRWAAPEGSVVGALSVITHMTDG